LIIRLLVVLPRVAVGGGVDREDEALLLLVGDDWAEDHHDVEAQDETGRRLGKARLPEGIARLHAMIGQHVGDDEDEQV
jgi:hypothetical protein